MSWRLAKLLVGLVLFGVGIWLGLQAHLGVGPWDVLAGGLSQHLGTPFGRTAIGVSVVVLVIGLLAGVRPGLGTVLNVVVIGSVVDLLLATPALDQLGTRRWRSGCSAPLAASRAWPRARRCTSGHIWVRAPATV